MIASLRLQNFRSFHEASFEFEPGVNIIIGPNASGKTNLLESILVAAQGSTYRGKDVDLVSKGSSWARIDVVTNTNTEHSVVIKLEGDIAKKNFTIESTEYRRLQAHHRIPVVIFEPNQLLYIATSPELRRSLIDNLNEQLNPAFSTTKRAYLRTLAQRNALLKTPNAQPKLFAWDVRLSELAGEIVKARQELIAKLNESLPSTYSDLASKKHEVFVEYISKMPVDNYVATMLKQLEATVSKDLERGFTGTGPHRDDVDIQIDDSSIQSFASRGEIRTVLLAIKIQEALLLEEKYNQKALMLLDDVFGELDGRRRKALTTFLQTHQAFITTTDADVVGKSFAQGAKQISISSSSGP